MVENTQKVGTKESEKTNPEKGWPLRTMNANDEGASTWPDVDVEGGESGGNWGRMQLSPLSCL